MEKFFLKRWSVSVENWQIGLLTIALVISVIIFGALVERGARNLDSAPGIAKVSFQIARLPVNSKRTINHMFVDDSPQLAKEQRFDADAGFTRFDNGDDGALLLARHDGDKNLSVVEIIDLKSGAVLHQYAPDIGAILSQSSARAEFIDLDRDRSPRRFPMNHPQLTEDGGLVFHGMNAPLTRIDVCSNIVWTIDGFFHHSIERDGDGNYWTANTLAPPEHPFLPYKGRDDAIAKVSPDGKVIFTKSVIEIFLENSLEHLVYTGHAAKDPIHLNDIQPVLADGPFWRRGDLFLSLRNSSVIVQYRPSTNEVIWYRREPWMRQHDVDIINDHEIAVFNNRMANLSRGIKVLGSNETIIYDFRTNEIKRPYSDAFAVNDIRTITQGLSEILPDGDIFVEEQNYGRILQMNAKGDIAWQYINRASDGLNYYLHWSRLIGAENAQRVAALADQQCNG